ncbi:ABC transporter permease [Halalkalirubrum salinum]|uniref:ABC transporter permease n=1 Tax=Halalkalirubrum salinum TaxID=2563889 RepID=UPI0010FB8D25|nr:ABC transporter permease [Halalkalirubrum salinum]
MASGTVDETVETTPSERHNDGEDLEKSNSGVRYILTQIHKDTSATIGLYVILFVVAVAVFASIDYYIFDYAFAERFLYHPERDAAGGQRLLPPVGMESIYGPGVIEHPLGTDHRGRDIFTRMIYGTRIAITAGFAATSIGLVGGTVIGAVSGYYGGKVDDLLQRFTEALYAIPFLVLIIAFMTAFGRDVTYAMVGVGIVSIPVFNRLIRSRVVSVREKEYIAAAKVAGAKDYQVILYHIIPNSFSPVLVQATLQIGVSILIIAGLSFLGFGAQPPTPSWGQMLAESRDYMLPAPMYSVWPGLAILITVFAFNLLGDGLQDALDPRIEN